MAATDLNILERLGLRFLRRDLERGDARIHRLTPSEAREVRGIARRIVIIATIAGAISGGVIGAGEYVLYGQYVDEAGAITLIEQLPYWWRYLAVSGLSTAVELAVIYWASLRGVARIGTIAGLRMSGQEAESVIALGLSRAALELPNPWTAIYGIDPYARVSRRKLLLLSAIYRLKVGATSFVVRMVLRRIVARAGVRVITALASIPIVATWNAVVAWRVMREARLRASAPLAIEEIGDTLAASRGALDTESRHLIAAAVGESIVCAGDAHPNFMLLLPRLQQELGVPSSAFAEWDARRDRLSALTAQAQKMLLTTLRVVTLLGGNRRRQRQLLADAHAACGHPFDGEALRKAMRELLDGQGVKQLPAVQ